MKILMIEPDRVLARTYAQALGLEGHQVFSESSAQNAIHTIDQNVPELIILEIQLAGHGGIEFLYELRSYPDWQNIPVLLHTLVPADSLQASQETLETLGVGGYLYKPRTTLQQLLATVSTVPQTIKI